MTAAHQLWHDSAWFATWLRIARHVALLLACVWSVDSATWYASPTGSATNGTALQPWSIPFAVTNTSLLSAGDTVLLKSGTFTCVDTNVAQGLAPILEFKVSGSVGSPITYKSETTWGAAFDGGLLFLSASNIVLHGVRVFWSGSTNRTRDSVYTHPPGISVFTHGVDLLHNLIENTGQPGIASWKTTAGKYIAGNIIRFVGQLDNTDGGNPRGSGMYLQNLDGSPEALIQGNISYFNYTTGMKAYGSTDIYGFRFNRNITTEDHEGGIFYHQDNYGSAGVTITTNYIWQGNEAIRLGYQLGNGGHSNAVVVGNYVVDTNWPIAIVDGWRTSAFTNNTFVNPYLRSAVYLEMLGEASGDVTSHIWNWNNYFTYDWAAFGPNAFSVKDVRYSFSDWKTNVLGDSNSVYTIADPTNLVVTVFRPSTDTNFVHVSVFNWNSSATTTVDLSSYFPDGSALRIYDAQNIPTACSTVNYGGGSVTLPLTLTNKASMLGTFPVGGYVWNGFEPRFRAFVVQRTASVPVTKTRGFLRKR